MRVCKAEGRALLCQRGTRCSMCTHSVCLPSSLQRAQTSSMHIVANIGRPVLWSRMRIRRV